MSQFLMSPEEQLQYELKKQQLTQQYAQQRAQNQFGIGLAQQQHGQQSRDLNLRFDALRERLNSNLARRGLMSSGIAQEDFSELGEAEQRQFGDALAALQGQLGQFQLRDAGLEQELQYGLQSIEADRLSQEAALAAQLQALTGSGQGVPADPPSVPNPAASYNPVRQAVRRPSAAPAPARSVGTGSASWSKSGGGPRTMTAQQKTFKKASGGLAGSRF